MNKYAFMLSILVAQSHSQAVAAGENGLGANADGALNGAAFCTGQSLSNGTQNKAGSCSLTIQGAIPAFGRMTSSLVILPLSQAKVDAQLDLTISISVKNLQTGFFSNAETQYYTSGQQLNAKGIVTGHQHVSLQQLGQANAALDPRTFDFFKGLNDAANAADTLTTVVPAGSLKVNGAYRICSITGSFTHQPVIMPVAQRGSQDDCIRINVFNAGATNTNSGAGSANGGSNSGAGSTNGGSNSGAGSTNGASNSGAGSTTGSTTSNTGAGAGISGSNTGTGSTAGTSGSVTANTGSGSTNGTTTSTSSMKSAFDQLLTDLQSLGQLLGVS